MIKGQRAKSVENPNSQKYCLPSILTPTFGDWKIIDQSKKNDDIEHPKISRKNPLYDKFNLNEVKRELKSQGTVNKENIIARTGGQISDENFSLADNIELIENFQSQRN